MQTDLNDPELPLGQLLLQVGREWRRSQVRRLEPFGLTAQQAHAFWMVARWSDDSPELRLSRIAERLRISPRSVTEVVDVLEDKGLIRRQPSVTDRRATVVGLTEHGRDLADQMRREDSADVFFAGLATGERARLRALLAKLAGEQVNC